MKKLVSVASQNGVPVAGLQDRLPTGLHYQQCELRGKSALGVPGGLNSPLRRALAPTFRSDISGWPDAALYPLASAAPRADRHTVGQQTLTRSRRLLAAGADSFS